ncbi:hypothetical protein RND81_08G163500 [Saponaria officinalis]|uniref:Protein kinase domain-containing protein n=1 Tax=Saponaria officinalis TaxID=3572 RepID=A0AAW1J8T6_SAPOF
MKRPAIFRFFQTHHQHHQGSRSRDYRIFKGNNENFMKNGALLLEERLSLFNGITNPIRFFSVDDINAMNVDQVGMGCDGDDLYPGVWNGNLVLVKIFEDSRSSSVFGCCEIEDATPPMACREIAVATQMGNHTNVHRLLGCCLHTFCPVQVYEWAENGNLQDRIFRYKEHNKEALEWKERLRVAWEIAHAAAYLHTAFRRPIIHRNLKPSHVILDQDDSARLSEFSWTVSIPEGKTYVEDCDVSGTYGYIAVDYMTSRRVAKSSDVYSFGILLLVLMSGKPAYFTTELDCGRVYLVDWVSNCCTADCVSDIVDPAINTNGVVAEELLKTLVELALRCAAADEECRPTMVDAATQLKNMIDHAIV